MSAEKLPRLKLRQMDRRQCSGKRSKMSHSSNGATISHKFWRGLYLLLRNTILEMYVTTQWKYHPATINFPFPLIFLLFKEVFLYLLQSVSDFVGQSVVDSTSLLLLWISLIIACLISSC